LHLPVRPPGGAVEPFIPTHAAVLLADHGVLTWPPICPQRGFDWKL